MIKVGVIGCGTIANAAHIPSYMKNADVEIKYFCDIIPERAQAAVEKYGCGVAVTNYHDVINDPEIDAISVCTPNRMHPVITIDALRAGKNVLCEKPAARTYAEVEQMVQAQRETGKILVIGVVNPVSLALLKPPGQWGRAGADSACGEAQPLDGGHASSPMSWPEGPRGRGRDQSRSATRNSR